jgi:hypothetical protein
MLKFDGFLRFANRAEGFPFLLLLLFGGLGEFTDWIRKLHAITQPGYKLKRFAIGLRGRGFPGRH